MVNPNTEEGLLMKGLMHKLPVKGEVPDCMLIEPFTEEVVPCNESAVMAAMPHPTNGVLMYKKLPGDCDVFKMHMADEKFPDQEPMVAVTCDSDDLGKVMESLMGKGEEMRYKNPKTGLEFEWTTIPPGFYRSNEGWNKSKFASDFEEEEEKEWGDGSSAPFFSAGARGSGTRSRGPGRSASAARAAFPRAPRASSSSTRPL